MHFTPYLFLVSGALAAPHLGRRSAASDDCEENKTTSATTTVLTTPEATDSTPEKTTPATYAASEAPLATISDTFTLAAVQTAGSTNTPTIHNTYPTVTVTASSSSTKAKATTKASTVSPSLTKAKTTTKAESTPSTYPVVSKPGKLPFTRMVAFGDNLSDNGNGSVAHGVAQAGDPTNKIYGASTWTNGPVAVSYLSSLLDTPLTKDLAYGHKNGGSLFGATIDNDYTKSTASAPSTKEQIASYKTSFDKATIAETLHFLWIGANDINLYHIDTSKTSNPTFAKEFSEKLSAQVKSLIDMGAPYILVPNLYAKNISLSSEFYADTPAKVANLGAAIQEANAAIEAELKQYGKKVIYYDVFSTMMEIWNDHAKYGITYVGKHACDVGNASDWDLYFTQKKGDEFYWMQYLDMTTHVHKLIAQDMEKKVAAHFA